MFHPIVPARIVLTDDNTPYSPTYDDVYHTTSGGLGQARQVFLDGNRLPSRWIGRERFTIIETGFGLGLNFLATWDAWRSDPARCAQLHFVSVEKHPFCADDLARLHAAWPELAPLAGELQRQGEGFFPPLILGTGKRIGNRHRWKGGENKLTVCLRGLPLGIHFLHLPWGKT